MGDLVERLRESATLETYNSYACGYLQEAADEIERMRDKMQQYDDAAAISASEECTNGEKHCTCVPLLRVTVANQKAEIERLQKFEEQFRALAKRVEQFEDGEGE